MNKEPIDKQVSFETVVWWLCIATVSGFLIGIIIMSGFVY